MGMRGRVVLPVIVSILILGVIVIPNAGSAYGQLCPVTGCLTDNLYVADISHQTVRQYDSTGTLLDENFITGVFPVSVAFDSAGNIYVADQGFFFTVRQYDNTGTLLDDDFAPGLSFPKAIAFDSAGNLYVDDGSLQTVRQYDSTGTLLNDDFLSNGFPPGVEAPVSIAFDSAGNLYVADLLGPVRQYDDAGTLLNADFAPDLSSPQGIAFDFSQTVVGGELLPIETTALLLAGAYTTASWMIPVLVSAIGFGILFTLRKNH